ncbi:MAG: TIGR00282 family metallophosphoesterase [Chlorobiota bacterium]|jgi:metallophosphoesterase (TIGR00282 family)|nr:TIGR00282 family metallophosphoesterase [Chlorobiota bacterium]QQS66310.1 MAG: TIGR00282 family metallophosphoesterase [Chlorobiota bacterium]
MIETIRIMFIGDVVGEPGLDIVKKELPNLIIENNIQFTIVNGENVYDGKGIRQSDADAIFKAGADVITSGNHIWEKWQSKDVLSNNNKVLRPMNYPAGNAGNGFVIAQLRNSDDKIGVINVQGRTFMQSIDCPFKSADWAINKILQQDVKVIFVDMHAEATAEKISLSWHLEGRATAVVGTHTHVQTNDGRILPGGTAALTDAGMTGSYDSVIGMKKDPAIKRFVTQTPHKFEVATEDLHIAVVIVEADTQTGNAISIDNFIYPELKKF